VRIIYEEDTLEGLGEVYLPFALERKYPNTAPVTSDRSVPGVCSLCEDKRVRISPVFQLFLPWATQSKIFALRLVTGRTAYSELAMPSG
jgi:hypothetical protein